MVALPDPISYHSASNDIGTSVLCAQQPMLASGLAVN
jgi:hypothetical protein